MSDDIGPPRPIAVAVVAMREERLLLRAVRNQIGELQNRTAFAEAMLRTARFGDSEKAQAGLAEIRKAVEALFLEIDRVMQGRTEAGPANDCRVALAQVLGRLDASAPVATEPNDDGAG